MLIPYFFRRYVHTLPMILPSMRPSSAIWRNRSLAYRGLHPACSATSTGCTLALSKAFARASSIMSGVNFATVTGLLSISKILDLGLYKCCVTYHGPHVLYSLRVKLLNREVLI